ncbi:FadR/GntR family transcriptional regulator [Jannaschia sp. KMU-145]|uniref:FadR/GntR family transcriptional regulator n=1 Tax=Jannaschia halovivens TaxID=3388667 RepID=UPI00396AF63E
MDAHPLLAADGSGLGHLPRRSMKDAIAEKLATLIGSGALSVGDPLPAERELAAAMGVSRETIRGAFLILSTRGILSVVQGARTTVASDDVGDLGLAAMPQSQVTAYGLDDVHDARLLVEARVARLAVETMQADDLARLDTLIDAQNGARDDPVRYLILDREFHTIIYRASGNAVLSDIAATLYSYLLGHRRRAVARPGAIDRSIADHRTILDALGARDGDALAHAFGVHERRIYETTRQLLGETGRNDQHGGDII